MAQQGVEITGEEPKGEKVMAKSKSLKGVCPECSGVFTLDNERDLPHHRSPLTGRTCQVSDPTPEEVVSVRPHQRNLVTVTQ